MGVRAKQDEMKKDMQAPMLEYYQTDRQTDIHTDTDTHTHR